MPSKTELLCTVFSAALVFKAVKSLFDDMIQLDWTAESHETTSPPMVLSHHHLTEDGSSWSKLGAAEPDEYEKVVGFRKFLRRNNVYIDCKSRMEMFYRKEDNIPLPNTIFPPSREPTVSKIDNSWNLSHSEKKEQKPGWKLRLLKSRSNRVHTASLQKRPLEPLAWHNVVMKSCQSLSTCNDDATSESHWSLSSSHNELPWLPRAGGDDSYGADKAHSSSLLSSSGNRVNARSFIPNNHFHEIRDKNTISAEKPYNVLGTFAEHVKRQAQAQNVLYSLW